MRRIKCQNCGKEYELHTMGIPLDGWEPCPYCGVEYNENAAQSESKGMRSKSHNWFDDMDNDAFEMIFGI